VVDKWNSWRLALLPWFQQRRTWDLYSIYRGAHKSGTEVLEKVCETSRPSSMDLVDTR